MLPQGVEFRPMTTSDVAAVLEIIRAHDEDDYETARLSFQEGGIADQYVLAQHAGPIGVTGYRPIEFTDRSYWLSWTYLDRMFRGQGLGEAMLEHVLAVLSEMDARKAFVNTSDLSDPVRGELYADAMKCYEAAGFRLELKYQDYYTPGESRLTYGRRIAPLYGARPVFEPNPRGIVLVEVDEITETDDAYFIDWDYSEDGSMFHPQDLTDLIGQVREWEGRCIFVGFPSALNMVEEAFKAAGFFPCGRLVDFYEDGLDEVHYRLNL